MDNQKFSCSIPLCNAKEGSAEKFWNMNRREAGGKLKVICGRHAFEARQRGFKTYRLTLTLERDAEREAQRLASSQFFAAFEKARAEKARRKGH